MCTRTGDLGPGVAWYLMQHQNLTPKKFSHLINHDSDLLGITETNSDMRDHMKIENVDNRAKEAVELFCYQTKNISELMLQLWVIYIRWVFQGALVGNSLIISSIIGKDLEFIGIKLKEKQNKISASIISADDRHITVQVIPGNEESMIAKSVFKMLKIK